MGIAEVLAHLGMETKRYASGSHLIGVEPVCERAVEKKSLILGAKN